MQIVHGTFKKITADVSTSKSVFVAEFQEEGGKEHFITLNKGIQFDEVKEGYRAKAVTINAMMAAHLIIYDKATIFFEQHVAIIKASEALLQEMDAVAVLRQGATIYIGTPPKEISLQSNNIIKASQHKTDLKAYETPSHVHDILLSSQQMILFDHMMNRMFFSYAKDIYRNYARTHPKMDYSEDVFAFELSGILINRINNRSDQYLSEHGRNIQKFYNGIDNENEKIRPILEQFQILTQVPFPLQEFYTDTELRHWCKTEMKFDEKRLNFPVMDLQAGSADGLLRAFDAAGYDKSIVFGTEIRDDIIQDDPRYHVIGGKNSVVFAPAIKDTLSDGSLNKATHNLLIYANPPYTAEDYVTKQSLESITSSSLLFGLFPTKNAKLLSHEIDGLIINVPRALTGYTDPKTPERFLMVFGARHTNNYEDGLAALLDGDAPENHNIVFEIGENETLEAAKQRLSILITNTVGSKLPKITQKIKEHYRYYVEGPEQRMNLVEHKLQSNISKFDRFLNSIAHRQEALDRAKEGILKQFTPIEIARTQRIFPDTRYYYNGSEAPKFYFREVISNLSLLGSYQQSSPNLFNVVKEVAQSLDIKMPLSVEKSTPFRLTQRNAPKEKTPVTNMHLGLMKSKYYPTLIDLTETEDKEELFDIFKTISQKSYSREQVEKMSDPFRVCLDHAAKMVLKNEQIILEDEGMIQNRECYVLQDAYEKDIGKINMSLTDFYKELERRGRFDIADYVELVTPSDTLKSTLVGNFLHYVENIARTIEGKTALSDLSIIKDAFKVRKELGKQFRNFQVLTADIDKNDPSYKEQQRTYNKSYRLLLVDFINTHQLNKHLEDKIIYPNINRILNDIVAIPELEKLKNVDKEQLKRLIHSHFIDHEMLFYENKHVEYNFFKEHLNPLGVKEDAFENFFYQMYDAVTPYFVAKKASMNAYIKLASMFIVDYTGMKLSHMKGVDAERIFDASFKKMFLNTFELKPHQYEEAINTVAIDKKLSMLLWEMRSGKTLTFSATLFLNALAKNETMSLLVETENLQDISNQIFEFMPQMFFQMRVFHTDPKKVSLNDTIVYERMLTDHFYPNLLNILNRRDSDFINGGGSTLNALKTEYNARMEALISHIDTHDLRIEDAKKQYADSPLVTLLDLCDT